MKLIMRIKHGWIRSSDKAPMTRLIAIYICLHCSLYACYGQIEYADVILDSYYSGANPEFNNFYGNNGTTDGCNLKLVSLVACLGNSDSIVCLPTGSYLTLGFTDNLVFDAPGQDDLFIQEQGGGQEFGLVFVSPDGTNFTFLDTLNGSQINSYDLANYAYDDVIKAVKIEGLDQGGCNPGLDLQRVFGVAGANCPCGADLRDFPRDLCAIDSAFYLNDFVVDTSFRGRWLGANVVGDTFNPLGLESTMIELSYVINPDHLVCPSDTLPYIVTLGSCDCNEVLNGNSIIDSCGLCLLATDPNVNASCKDCAGDIDGIAVIDSCGVCLRPSDALYNISCLDCNGTLEGTAQIDLCGECLEPEDPLFNTTCPEIFDVYLPNIISLDDNVNDRTGIFVDQSNIGFLRLYEVYDRWGNLIFALKDQPLREVENWWDGRFNNRKVMPGIYLYRLLVEFEIKQDLELIGSITVID